MKMKAVVLEGANQFGPKMIDRPIIGSQKHIKQCTRVLLWDGYSDSRRKENKGCALSVRDWA